jgi:electron transport complex protein RnfB
LIVNEALIDSIDDVLPQTQCRQCGYEGCRPYAAAVAAGQAGINQCPPGGDAGIRNLAGLLGREYQPLDPAFGMEKPREVAVVVEERCIGCTLCIQACPVDAILGAAKQMHSVITDLCTGCGLCVAPCPVDCIEMHRATGPDADWNAAQAADARGRFKDRNARLVRAATADPLPRLDDATLRRTAVEAAVARAQSRRAAYLELQRLRAEKNAGSGSGESA